MKAVSYFEIRSGWICSPFSFEKKFPESVLSMQLEKSAQPAAVQLLDDFSFYKKKMISSSVLKDVSPYLFPLPSTKRNLNLRSLKRLWKDWPEWEKGISFNPFPTSRLYVLISSQEEQSFKAAGSWDSHRVCVVGCRDAALLHCRQHCSLWVTASLTCGSTWVQTVCSMLSSRKIG